MRLLARSAGGHDDPGVPRQQLLEVALAAGSAGRHKADLDEAKLDAKELEKPTAEELEASRPT